MLNDLFESVKSDPRLAGEYGVTDIHEFVAEALSNPRFQEKLKGVRADEQSEVPPGIRGAVKSLWDKLRSADPALARYVERPLHEIETAAGRKLKEIRSFAAPDEHEGGVSSDTEVHGGTDRALPASKGERVQGSLDSIRRFSRSAVDKTVALPPVPPPSQRHLYRFARNFSEKIKSGNVQEAPRDAQAAPKDGTGDTIPKPGDTGAGESGSRSEKAAATNSRTAKGTVRVDTAKPTDKEKLDVDLRIH
jgi:hypothetical protein